MSDCGNVQKVFVPTKDTKKAKAPTPTPISGVGITDIAAEKIKLFTEKDGTSAETHGLRISVVADGCSGKSYQMDLAEIEPSVATGDKVFQKAGATVLVDKLSYMFVIGSELDYVETLLMSGFQLTNPNIKRSCSCGSSFSVG